MFFRSVEKKDVRYWEIDLFRGIAVIMMIVYHIFFDVTFLAIIDLPVHSLPFLLFLYPIGTIFLVLVGVSLTLKYSQIKDHIHGLGRFISFFKQGSRIFLIGLLITLVTYLYPHNGFIMFGVLHCIGLSIILAYPFIRHKYTSIISGSLCIVLGIFVSVIQVDMPWLLWIGLRPIGFYTIDYFPLLPWFGVVLVGISIGNTFYPDGKRVYHRKEQRNHRLIHAITYLGQHSLVIYRLHQPIIFGLLYLEFMI